MIFFCFMSHLGKHVRMWSKSVKEEKKCVIEISFSSYIRFTLGDKEGIFKDSVFDMVSDSLKIRDGVISAMLQVVV